MMRLIFAFISIFTVFLLAGCNGGPGVQSYYHGNEAYQCGQYRVSLAYYSYAAHDNIVPAQYALGYQYFYGIGTKTDEAKGIMWMQRAAGRSVRARYALDLIQANRPPQPWLFQLKDAMHPTTKPLYYDHKACMISVKCEPT